MSSDSEDDGAGRPTPRHALPYQGGFPTIGATHTGKRNRDDGDDMGTGPRGSSKSSGGFQSLGLSKAVFRAIMKLGYKVPTPIQRQCLPIALSGRDLVGMARTGSGKTAAFLIPLVERLQEHSSRVGARAVVLAPTRELAQQTYRFCRSLSKFTNLRSCLLVGGDSMTAQFESIANNPDIIIATPGRLMHHLMEIPEFTLRLVEYVVFDEADRLFEMGFAEQLKEIMSRMAESRQTLLFSATLPKAMMEFARAGLRNPEMVRLDVQSNVSDQLSMGFFTCRPAEKLCILLWLLEAVIPSKEQVIIFAATKHHVEYLNNVLERFNVSCAPIFGAMDMVARKINLAKFRQQRCRVMLVTDVAARGIDLPLLDNVINYDFPSNPKLFVHRVGRVARSGRTGTAFSLVANSELPYMIDVLLFLSRPVTCEVSADQAADGKYTLAQLRINPELVHYGRVPQSVLEEHGPRLNNLLQRSPDLLAQARVCENAYQQYNRTRGEASRRSVSRAKKLPLDVVHPLLKQFQSDAEPAKLELLSQIANYRPQQSILSLGTRKRSQKVGDVSTFEPEKHRSSKREAELNFELDSDGDVSDDADTDDDDAHHRHYSDDEDGRDDFSGDEHGDDDDASDDDDTDGQDDDDDDEKADDDFLHASRQSSKVRKSASMSNKGSSKRKSADGGAAAGAHDDSKRRLSKAERKRLRAGGDSSAAPLTKAELKKAQKEKDAQIFVTAQPATADFERNTERMLTMKSTRDDDRKTALERLEESVFDLTPEDGGDMASKKRMFHWDKRKKKYIRTTAADLVGNGSKKRLRTDDGTVVGADGKLGKLYNQWAKRTRRRVGKLGADENPEHHAILSQVKGPAAHDELKSEDAIRKERLKKAKLSPAQRMKAKTKSKNAANRKSQAKIQGRAARPRSVMLTKRR